MQDLEIIDLSAEEMEALRLINLDQIDQTKAAERMKIHQSTFSRILHRARTKVTEALIHTKAIRVHNHQLNHETVDTDHRCCP